MKNINHPILPQLDYSFLNITVANPAINRSVAKNTVNESKLLNNVFAPQTIPAVQFSGPIATPKNYDIPIFSKPQTKDFSNDLIPDLVKPKEIPKINVIPEFKNLSINGVSSQPLKFDVSEGCSDTNFSKPKTNDFKNYEFLNLADVSTIEPRSLDLPTFEPEIVKDFDDEEFTEFQSATVVTTNDEYADFQSASPIVKYELDNFISEPIQEVSSSNPVPSFGPDLSPISDESIDLKINIDADKYDVFRTLMDHPKTKEKEEVEDVDEAEEEEDDNFGDFFGADVQPKTNKELSIKVI